MQDTLRFLIIEELQVDFISPSQDIMMQITQLPISTKYNF